MMSKEEAVDSNLMTHALTMLNKITKMRSEGQQCDFTIKVGEKDIRVHKTIICAISDYFSAMLRHDTKESQNGEVEMTGVDYDCVVLCVDFMYTGEIKVLPGKYVELMDCANLMQLEKFCKAVASILEDKLNASTFFSIRHVANLYTCQSLKEKCCKFAAQNLNALAMEDSFKIIDKDYIIELLGMASEEYVSEKIKLNALLTWIHSDTERCAYFEELLGLVKLSDIPIGYRRNLIETDELIYKDWKVLKQISISVMDSLNVEKDNGLDDSVDRICIFDKGSGYLMNLNPKDRTWSQMQNMNDDMKQSRFSAVLVDHCIIVLMSNKKVFKLEYHDRNGSWNRMTDMLYDHGWCPPATVHNSQIFVIGGHNHCSSKSCERYVLQEDTWYTLPDQVDPTQFTEIHAIGEDIYSIGGRVCTYYTEEVRCFSMQSMQWSTVPPMKESRGGVAASSCGEMLYVFGGHHSDYKELDMIESYNTTTKVWSTLPPMRNARSWFNVHEIDGVFYAAGGYKSLNFIEKIDFSDNTREIIKVPQDMIVCNSVKIKL